MNYPPIHIICGATASGKSALALSQALASGGVIINADSQQLYRELQIITARPSSQEMQQVPHKLYGTLSGDDPADVAKWLRLARMEIDWARGQGMTPYVVGGTGMYIRALMQGLADIPDVPPAVAMQARNDLHHMGPAAFHERLTAVDPVLAARVGPTDSQRMLRGYSVWLASGKPLTYWQQQPQQSAYQPDEWKVTYVELGRDQLYERCNLRVLKMLEEGAVEEVRQLLACAYSKELPIMRVIGVPELAAALQGQLSMSEAISQMQQATRNYAKRQMTWFRHQLPPSTP